jgi:cellulose synthase (UDP-forming)
MSKKESAVLRAAKALCYVSIGALLSLAVVTTPLPLAAQALFGVVLYVAALLLNRFQQRTVTLVMMSLSLLVTTRYMYFRLNTTLPSFVFATDAVLGMVLVGAELYAFVMLFLGYFQGAWPLERKPISLPADLTRWPSVDIFIPTYNEPLSVVAPTVLAARAIDWPHDKLKVYILDDGCRPEFRAFAADVGVEYFERIESDHAKAGNINKALGKTHGEFVLILDCDHVPTRSILQVGMGWLLRDSKLALVQTPHHFYSPDPFERNLQTFRIQPNEGELFYRLIQRGNDLWNATFFCGSCAMIRRTALEAVGGIAVETVTEDAHTALRMQRRGYRTAYIDVAQIGGLATESLSAHVGQRQRWARGMAQIFRIDNPFLGRGLSLGQRLCYAASMLHFFHALPRLVFLLAPLSYLFFGMQILQGSPMLVLAYSLPHLLHASMTNSRVQGKYRYSFWSEVYETSLAPFILLPTTVALFAPKLGKFNVTAKGGKVGRTYFDRRIAWPHIALAALNLAGLIIGLRRYYLGLEFADVALLNAGWCGYNLLMLGAALSVARETQQRRSVPRLPVKLPAALLLPNGHARAAETRDLSLAGARLLAPNLPAQAAGAKLSLSWVDADRIAIPATVVRHDGDDLQLRFDELSVDARAALVERMFSRADTWANWHEGRQLDLPLVEISRIFLHGLRGLGQAARTPFSWRPRS